MSPSYRIVQFVPDPFSGARTPVAALVTDGDALRVVRSPHLPGPECLGGARRAALVRLIVDALLESAVFDRLPASVGPQAVLDPVRNVPVAGLDAAERWVLEHALPHPEKVAKGETTGGRAPHRATLGKRFFETWRVAEYVRATFKPASDFDGRLARMSAYGEVSHWVEGPASVLLMEPIAPRRHQFADDLRDVARLFASYRFALHQEPPTADLARLVAYLLPGGSDEQRADVAAGLPAAHEVVDTEDVSQRARFLEIIRDIGRRGDRQQRVEAEG